MRFSAPVKKHWLGSFSSGLRGFVPVVRDRWEQGGPLARGQGEGGGIPWAGGGGGRDRRAYDAWWPGQWPVANTALQVSYVFVLQNPAQAPAVGLVRRAMGSRGVDSQSENFKLLGLMSLAHLRKIELIWVRLLKKREGFGV